MDRRSDLPRDVVPDPDVIVVPLRPGRSTWPLVPPLLVVILGAGFLAYRASARDWRGASRLYEALAGLTPGPAQVRPAEPPAKALPKAEKPPVPKSEVVTAVTPAPAAEAKPKPKATPEPDPLADIEREAEATRKRTAELESFKEKEAQKLAETEDERRRADRREQRDRMFGRGLALPPEFEKMVRRQQEFIDGQVAAMLGRQQAEMDEFRKRFFDGHAQGFALGPQANPAAPPVWPPMQPGFPRPPARRRNGGDAPREGVFRTPDGGVGRFRQFQGPGGAGFELHWQSGGGTADAPPPPRPRVVD